MIAEQLPFSPALFLSPNLSCILGTFQTGSGINIITKKIIIIIMCIQNNAVSL